MTPDILNKWLDALRGDRFKQTHSEFQNDQGYCCLGVLCVVTDEPPITRGPGPGGNWGHVDQLLANTNVAAMRLARMNDDGMSFPMIADWLEAHMKIASDA